MIPAETSELTLRFGVETPRSSGEQLVNRAELSHHLLENVFICLITAQMRSIVPGIER